MTEQHPARQSQRRWAPWWLYLLVILGANYLRQAVMPYGTVPEWAVVVIVVIVSTALFALITAIHRAVGSASVSAPRRIMRSAAKAPTPATPDREQTNCSSGVDAMHQSTRHIQDVRPGLPRAPKSAALRRSRSWRAAAVAAAGWAAAFAVLSLYWALGGRWGAGTIGPAIEDPAVAGDRAFVVVLWASVALKAAGAVVALALLVRWRTPRARTAVLVMAWAATLLTGAYAVLGTAQHALMAIGVLAVPTGLGVAALRWHLALWDPIWLLGGLLFLLATFGYASARDRVAGTRRVTSGDPIHDQRARWVSVSAAWRGMPRRR